MSKPFGGIALLSTIAFTLILGACTNVDAYSPDACMPNPSEARLRAHIDCVFEQHISELNRVYNFHRRFRGAFGGKVILGLAISAEGRVTQASVLYDETKNPAYAQDLATLTDQFDFGHAADAVTVSYPVEFIY